MYPRHDLLFGRGCRVRANLRHAGVHPLYSSPGKGGDACRIVLVCSRVECPTYVLTEYILHTYIDATQTPAVTKQGPVNQSLE